MDSVCRSGLTASSGWLGSALPPGVDGAFGTAEKCGRGALLSARASAVEPRHGRTECAPTALQRNPGGSADFGLCRLDAECDFHGVICQ